MSSAHKAHWQGWPRYLTPTYPEKRGWTSYNLLPRQLQIIKQTKVAIQLSVCCLQHAFCHTLTEYAQYIADRYLSRLRPYRFISRNRMKKLEISRLSAVHRMVSMKAKSWEGVTRAAKDRNCGGKTAEVTVSCTLHPKYCQHEGKDLGGRNQRRKGQELRAG